MTQIPTNPIRHDSPATQADIIVLRGMIEQQDRDNAARAVMLKQVRDILTGNGHPEDGLVYKVSEVSKLAKSTEKMFEEAKKFLKTWGSILVLGVAGGPQALDAIFQKTTDPALVAVLEQLAANSTPAETDGP